MCFFICYLFTNLGLIRAVCVLNINEAKLQLCLLIRLVKSCSLTQTLIEYTVFVQHEIKYVRFINRHFILG